MSSEHSGLILHSLGRAGAFLHDATKGVGAAAHRTGVRDFPSLVFAVAHEFNRSFASRAEVLRKRLGFLVSSLLGFAYGGYHHILALGAGHDHLIAGIKTFQVGTGVDEFTDGRIA